jgi:hypothetical protein
VKLAAFAAVATTNIAYIFLFLLVSLRRRSVSWDLSIGAIGVAVALMLYSQTNYSEEMHLFSSPRRAATTVATNLGMDVANPSKEEESHSPDGKQEDGGESSRGVEKGEENVSITIPDGKKAVTEERASSANSDGRDTIKEDEGEWATNLFYAYARRVRHREC